MNNFTSLSVPGKILSEKSDEQLLAFYADSSDMDSLGELYRRYMDLVYGVCLKYFKEPEEAKDAVINIFEELTSKLKKYEVANFKGWLYQLSKNHCLMKLRSRKGKAVNVDIDIMHLSQIDHLDDKQEKEGQFLIMEACMEELAAEQKQAVELFYLKEKCYKEISTITNTDINKVRSFIQNGRRNLKICMERKAMEV